MSDFGISRSDRARGRSILVPLGGQLGDFAALEAAIAFAKRSGGNITCHHTWIDAVESAPVLGAMFPQGAILSAVQHLERADAQRSERARQTFDEACRRHALPIQAAPQEGVSLSMSWKEATSSPDEGLLEAHYHDLIVMSRDADLRTERIRTMLMQSGRPLLLSSPKAPEVVGRSIAIAWKESAAAARAVTAATCLFQGVESVCILTAFTDEAGGDRDRLSAEKLATNLRWQGIEARTMVEQATPESETAVLQELAYGQDCDLLVMGAYGHSRLREFVFGGVTREMLSNCAIPVLMMR
jgi:nucleotide-binding universal stress UspA family protein